MGSDGKHLEGLVSFVEETLLPQGFDVRTNQKVFNDEGVQIAEFDIEIRGRVGTTSIAWLIECRDRPGTGAAPGSWIEQLVGRRTRFGFNKVTAVSTTGFSAGAIEFAKAQGIELRQVESLSPDAFSGWLQVQHLNQTERRSHLVNASVLLEESACLEDKNAVAEALAKATGSSPLLRSTRTEVKSSMSHAFLGAVEVSELFEGILPNGPVKSVNLRVDYNNDEDHFVIETTRGPIRVAAIVFQGDLSVIESLVPITISAEYRDLESGDVISQLASFESQTSDGKKIAVDLHKLSSSGVTHVVVRTLGDASGQSSDA